MKRAIWGGVVSGIVFFLASWTVGELSRGEAHQLLEGVQPTIRFMCSSVMTATATILALLLTLLSFTSNRDNQLKAKHYERIQRIAKLSSGTFIAAMLLLMFLSVPLLESESSLRSYYTAIYYVIQVYASLMGGALITVILMLYDAAKNTIILVNPEWDSEHLVVTRDEQQEEMTEAKS